MVMAIGGGREGRLQLQFVRDLQVGWGWRCGRDQTVVNWARKLMEHRNIIFGSVGGDGRDGALWFLGAATGYNLRAGADGEQKLGEKKKKSKSVYYYSWEL